MEPELIDQWIVQSLQGRSTRAEDAKLASWRAADPANERRYQETAAVWRALEGQRKTEGAGRPSASQVIAAARERQGGAAQAGEASGRESIRSVGPPLGAAYPDRP